ncbi:hypothetical protein P8825_14885 [Shouchella clausii]|uniref:hypothetical protein n=1 Tax=Shouchella clausii TaxID=79880 RepID=UPI002DBBA19E|nr:hypothetical protein [Shouchella clausii]MEB5480849.1 hypothetical protein [Shouchella clausii]
MNRFGISDHVNEILELHRKIVSVNNTGTPTGFSSGLSKPFAEIQPQLAIVGERLVKATDHLDTVAKTMDYFDTVYKSISSIPILRFIPDIADLEESIEKSNKEIKRIPELLLTAGYPPSLSVDGDEAKELIREYDVYLKNDSVTLEDFISKINYIMTEKLFRPQVIDMLKQSWERSQVLEGRKQLTRQALTAHNIGMYALTVPALLTQLEGIIAQSYQHKEKLHTYQLKLLISDLFSDAKDWCGFEKHIRRFYLEQVLGGSFLHGKQTDYETNRHAIAHGAALPDFFGKKEVSLRIIILLDAILDSVSKLTEKDIIEAKKKLEILSSVRLARKDTRKIINSFTVLKAKNHNFVVFENDKNPFQGVDYEVALYIYDNSCY